MKIETLEVYPIYPDGLLRVGRQTGLTGMQAGVPPLMAQIDIAGPHFPKCWFPLQSIRSLVHLRKELGEPSAKGHYIVPKAVFADCYENGWRETSRKVLAIEKLLRVMGCECKCDFEMHIADCDGQCRPCLACQIREIL